MTARLVVSLSDVDASTVPRCERLAARLDGLGVPLSLLVAPRAHRAPVGWLRERTARGDALVLHGYNHAFNHAAGAGWGRRAEFAALPAHEAGLRLLAAARSMEQLRLATTLFAPPRWHGSPGTMAALTRLGFTVYADLTAVHDLATGAEHGGRVLGIRADPWSGRALVLAAVRAARRGGLVRLAVSAADLASGSHAGRTAVDAVRAAVAHGADPNTYATVTGPAAVRRLRPAG